MLGNGGKLTGISYNGEEFNISYISSSNVNYKGKIKPSGEVTELERTTENIDYTQVWANFFEAEGKMTYTTSKDESATISWDISKPIYSYADVPWYYYDNSSHYNSGYGINVTKVEISEDLYPESTQFMFYYLKNANQFDGLNLLLSKITEIGADMFYECENLSSITIQNNIVKIGENAFDWCISLTSVTIPGSVVSIEKDAFFGCTSLTSIDILNGVKNIGDTAFAGCSSLTNINIPDSILHIGGNAFNPSNAYLTLANPTTGNCIGDYAFSGCKALISINISEGVTSIGYNAFRGCTELTNIYAFYNCDKLADITIPENVEVIGKNAFAFMDNLKTLNYNAKDISRSELKDAKYCYPIFQDCNNLTEVNIGNGVEMLPDWFAYKLSIKIIQLPNSLASIGDYAFRDCDALTDITIPENVELIGKNAFAFMDNLKVVNYNAKDISKSELDDEQYCYPIFQDCSNLTEVNIGSGVKLLPSYFAYGLNITVIQFPNWLEKISEYAFYNCTSLKSINIPETVTSIEENAFKECTSLINVTILNGTKSIGDWSFYGCSSLTSIVIPESVKNIGKCCFSHCPNLETIYYNAKDASDSNFYNSERNIYNPPFYGCGRTIIIGNNVEVLPRRIFTKSLITSIEIPNSVTSIDNQAFINCDNLTTITVKKSSGSITGSPWGATGATVNWEP